MKKWYAVFTKPGQEQVAKANLQRQTFETYLPLIDNNRRRRGQWKKIIEPLFPRYLFVRMDIRVESTASIRSTRGVTTLVRFGNEPAAVPDTLMESLKHTEDPETGLHSTNQTLFKQGDRVIIANGPFKDIIGIFQTQTGHQRAMILLEILGRQNRIAIDHSNLIPET